MSRTGKGHGTRSAHKRTDKHHQASHGQRVPAHIAEMGQVPMDELSIQRMLMQLFGQFARNVGTVKIVDKSRPATVHDEARYRRAVEKRNRRAAKRLAHGI